MSERAPFDIPGFLAEPLRLAQVASVAVSGAPLLGSLWFSYAGGRFWFSSARDGPFPSVVRRRGAEVAVLVDQFCPPELIRQVRVRGPARLERHDPRVVERIYARYLGQDLSTWPSFFRDRCADSSWVLWTATPAAGMAVATPHFRGPEVRWHRVEDCPF